MARLKRWAGGGGVQTSAPPPIAMTEEEERASRVVYERLKPELDRILSGLSAKWSVPAARGAEGEEMVKQHDPSVGYVCDVHRQVLDPWGLCHHECRQCERGEPIWRHKGRHVPAKAPLVRW